MSTFDKSEKEVAELNQYWYSDHTIEALVDEIQRHATRAAFLSSPSLYFSLTNATLRANSKVFEFDRRWEKDPGFVFYDFNEPEKIPVSAWEHFDFVVVDPPFITEEVWSKYAQTIKLILAKGGKVLLTSVIENHRMLEAVCDVQLMVPLFRPSIPHLTYQYHCFTNYPSSGLEVENPELPPEDPQLLAARNVANDMRESQQAFAAQVQGRNRQGEAPLPAQLHASEANAPLYDPALKWSRVPEGLTEYANGADAPPPDEAKVDFGPEYAAVEGTRTKLEAFKRSIDQLTKFSDALLKAKEGQRRGGERAVGLQASYDATMAQRQRELSEMRTVVEEVRALGKVDSSVLGVMMECIEDFEGTEIVRERLAELSADATRKYKSKIFNRQRELLQDMKRIKAGAKKDGQAEATPAATADAIGKS